MIKNDTKIGFVTNQAAHPDLKVASTRIRVTWPARYAENFIVTEDEAKLKKCAVVVFQTRIDRSDIKLAGRLKEKNIKIVCDFTDPHWLHEYGGCLSPELKDMVEVADCITLPTQVLEKSFTEIFEKPTAIVKDRLDLELYDKVKVHTNRKDFRILWHGSYGNLASLEIARNDLEKVGAEYPITLVCVYDNCSDYEVKKFDHVKLEIYEWSNEKVIEELLKADISINPRFDNWKSYKSNNKTVTAWALGIPCVEYNFYEEIKRYMSTSVRNAEAVQYRKTVEKNYNAIDTAKEWIGIARSLINTGKPKAKKNIVVYTAISQGYDGLREDQIISPNADYVAFVDVPTISYVWDVRNIYRQFLDPMREAKIYKILPWQYFDCEYSIWIDGTIAIKCDPQILIDKFLDGYDMAVFKHKWRDDIYEEYEVDMKVRTREPFILRETQRQKYLNEGHPAHSGLFECGVLVRRHSKKVKRLCETWWSEISAFSASDQCSFMYSVRKHDFEINPLCPGDMYENPYFQYVPHHKTWTYVAEPKEVVLSFNEVADTQKVKLKRISHETFHSPLTGRLNHNELAEVPGAIAKQFVSDYPGAFVIIY